MEIKPVKTKADYRAALKEIEVLMSARAGSIEGERVDVLVTLVEAYERRHFSMDRPDLGDLAPASASRIGDTR